STVVPDGDEFEVQFFGVSPDSVAATSYSFANRTTGALLFEGGTDLSGEGSGPTGSGLLPVVTTQETVEIDTTATRFVAASGSDAAVIAAYRPVISVNRRRPFYPDDVIVRFSDTVVDTSLAANPFQALPAKFQIFAVTDSGEVPMNFLFRDLDADGTLSRTDEIVDMVTYIPQLPGVPLSTWRFSLDPDQAAPASPPAGGDVFELVLTRPYSEGDSFVFEAIGESRDQALARADFSPYVVPNPYIASASFEPERFAVSGRGERRLEFRGLPANATIRIYGVRGDLVQTLRHDGSDEGFVAWDLRTKDNLDLAPGLYLFYVDGGPAGTATGKFAVVK
ncbi:MAG: hypothetical protein KC591_17580, partial [Gemmatimonadetes bacterium]|nr:hypothetical protein [Gemmatimonadota bacterium]